MKNLVAYVVAGGALLSGAVWAADAPSPQDIASSREKTMKQLGGDAKAAFDPATPQADAKIKLADAIKIAESIPSLFPKGTGIGDPGVTDTRALRDIWRKPAEFKAAADALVVALKSSDAALDGERAKFDATKDDVFKACGGCHILFRGPATE